MRIKKARRHKVELSCRFRLADLAFRYSQDSGVVAYDGNRRRWTLTMNSARTR
jgi:hypothetical protein